MLVLDRPGCPGDMLCASPGLLGVRGTSPRRGGEGAASAGAGTGPKAVSVAARGSSCFEHGESSPQAPSGCPGTVLQGSLPARAQHHPPTRTCSPPAHRGSQPAAAFPMGAHTTRYSLGEGKETPSTSREPGSRRAGDKSQQRRICPSFLID